MERYLTLSSYLKREYGEKLYKLSLDGGMTCPNRDGTLGTGGCIFCSAGGSGDFTPDCNLPIKEQIQLAKNQISAKFNGSSYIAYFQAFTNTYAPIEYLENLYEQVLSYPEIKILSIATRPDCLSDEIIDLLARLNKKKPVWIELGLQTIHKDTAQLIHRGYETPVFFDAVKRLRAHQISVITHVIIGLPGESDEKLLQTISSLNETDIQGIKLHLLHVLKHTQLEQYMLEQDLFIPTMEEYFATLSKCINHLRPDLVIHRLTGDGPKDLLIAPKWTGNKRYVLNQMNKYFKTHDVLQGKEYQNGKTASVI